MDFKPGDGSKRPHIHHLSDWFRMVRRPSQNNSSEVIDSAYGVLGQSVLNQPTDVKPPIGGVPNGRIIEVQPVNKDIGKSGFNCHMARRTFNCLSTETARRRSRHAIETTWMAKSYGADQVPSCQACKRGV